MGRDTTGQHDEARCRHVEPMHDEDVGVAGLDACGEAVAVACTASRHGQQTRRLGGDDAVSVEVQDRDRTASRIRFERGGRGSGD